MPEDLLGEYEIGCPDEQFNFTTEAGDRVTGSPIGAVDTISPPLPVLL